ncbi:hypothetical protein [Paucibacter sp. DJ2R-2]|uniref:Cap15 family cyclic dinucleotide receptor domain-containing protein n=1 Tax=Paucibacter sp. DJ2R-2 TaxID=2893558 RepID=UPI0021E4EC38|nr:hypothetical protein [Paucibacter sp. DJ2R-2]MCV2438643.1 hypothetical protein [Paucibacter sp. DJ2R-2]
MGGVNRARVGRVLALGAGVLSSWAVYGLLSAVDLARALGWNVNLPPAVLSLVGAGAFFGLLYYLLSRFAWKWPVVTWLIKVPDISGAWDCEGVTLDAVGKPKHCWQGEITIKQCWDKLRIQLKTSTSGSSSISAAVAHDSINGFVLLYHYRNEPKPGPGDLAAHAGCAVMTIGKELESATGEYFNGRGRLNFGTMQWRKRN